MSIHLYNLHFKVLADKKRTIIETYTLFNTATIYYAISFVHLIFAPLILFSFFTDFMTLCQLNLLLPKA